MNIAQKRLGSFLLHHSMVQILFYQSSNGPSTIGYKSHKPQEINQLQTNEEGE